MTKVVNMRHEAFHVYIGRKSPFGNPYTHMKGPTLAEYIVASREEAIAQYKVYFLERIEKDPEFRNQVTALRDKVLGCFCKPLSCHGDIIVEWLDKQPSP